MNSDLKQELERRIPDTEIPPLALDSIKHRGRNLQWRHRLTIAGSGLLAVVVITGSALFLVDNDRKGQTSAGPTHSSTEAGGAASVDRVVSLQPDQVRVGDSVDLRVHNPSGVYGLLWELERRDGSSWKFFGYLVVGPGEQWDEERFYLPPDVEGSVDDIGFRDPASMAIKIPELEPGAYRLGQEFVGKGPQSLENRTQRHYGEFEVVE